MDEKPATDTPGAPGRPPGPGSAGSGPTVERILAIIKGLRELRSLDGILDRLLLEARQLVRADSGTIFLVEGDSLVFSYVHNDSLFSDRDIARQVYLTARLPINGDSLAGYTAVANQPLVIDDAHALPPGHPVRFNASFDARTGYRTRAVLSLPITSSRGRVIAVLQIINPATAAGAPAVFGRHDVDALSLLADQAAAVIETGIVTEDFILRMCSMAELRDPCETGAHVKRVGAFAAEIYHAMQRGAGLPERELKRRKAMMRVAAMLHDVGKVGVSDAILKKPGRLTAEEYAVMQRHTELGASLFNNPVSEVHAWARDVALHHHQRFDGTGYPGGSAAADVPAGGPPLAGEDIPLPARITAVADVYDALTSRRIYKPPFGDDQALEELHRQAGGQFDPLAVAAFFSIHDVILAIRARYPDREA
ncbi:MAG: HD domain-containing phosphohydrolase [Solidesulfovibrio sp. DCME]|uniref:HD domain-containing phosphohydrolase n=1 Tax=Solidesulfovibrio sp. DCME TaxID=3447380 RepID=UPI003D0F8816